MIPWTLVVAIDTLMIADLLPKGVLQTFSYTGTKDLSKAGAVVMPMKESLMRVQKLCNSYVASSTAHVTSSGTLSFYAHLFSVINAHALLTYKARALMIQGAFCAAHLVCLLLCNMISLMPSI